MFGTDIEGGHFVLNNILNTKMMENYNTFIGNLLSLGAGSDIWKELESS